MTEPTINQRETGVFGTPASDLVEIPPDARQFSPLIPGSQALESEPPGCLRGMIMSAVPGTLERRHDLALMLKALEPGSAFIALAPKDMGGARLGSELASFGCVVNETAKRHHRICSGARPPAIENIETAIRDGAPRRLEDLGLWSQPGIFSWNRLDSGTQALMAALPLLSGVGADLGCGIGILAHGILASPKVTGLHLVDIDRRAVNAARRNVDDERAEFLWADVRQGLPWKGLDFVVMNPPFHDAGNEDRHLGAVFIERAAGALRAGGRLWLVANKHLPYENVLKALFCHVEPVTEARGFKVISARK